MITQTQNLILRDADLDDDLFIKELVNSPTWLKYIGQRNVNSIAQAATFIEERLMASYKTHGFGLYVVVLKQSAAAIGLCGFVKRDYLTDPDIGFALLPEFAGRGYGKEAAMATLQYGVKQLQLKTILGITSQENTISQQLLTRLGLDCAGLITPPEEETPLVLYKMNV